MASSFFELLIFEIVAQWHFFTRSSNFGRPNGIRWHVETPRKGIEILWLNKTPIFYYLELIRTIRFNLVTLNKYLPEMHISFEFKKLSCVGKLQILSEAFKIASIYVSISLWEVTNGHYWSVKVNMITRLNRYTIKEPVQMQFPPVQFG